MSPIYTYQCFSCQKRADHEMSIVDYVDEQICECGCAMHRVWNASLPTIKAVEGGGGSPTRWGS